MKTNLRKIIKEEVLKEDITSKCVNTIINKPHTKACSVFNGRLGALCEKFNELEYQLSDESGLGMQSIIDNETDKHKTNIPEDLKNQFIEGLRLLYRTGKYSRNYIIQIKNMIDESRLVYKDGEWHHVNKLNTNYSDLAELLTCYLYDTKREELNTIIDLFDKQSPKQVISYIKPMLGGFKDYFSLDELMSFTRNSTENTRVGESSEDEVVSLLETNGLNIDYVGGNGDFLDMKFGVDIIADMKLIQVKASIKSVKRIRRQIDWVAVSNQYQGVGVYDKQGNVVIHNGNRLCEGVLCSKKVVW
jgi:hypothetical protein